MAAGARHGAIRVRMYRVGFGDCFLVSLPESQGRAKHLLFDCGVHPKGDIGTLGDVVKDVAAVSGGALAAVVVTHEHADHISGFGSREDDFARLQTGEIWMPWAMDTDDATAAALRRKRFAVADALSAHFAAAGASAGALEILANLRGNERALQALRSRFQGAARRIRYLKAGDRLQGDDGQAGAADVDGLTVDVLGPPTDPDLLKKMDPPESQRYLRSASGGPKAVGAIRPFSEEHALAPAAGRRQLGLGPSGGRRLEREVAGSMDDSLEGLAVALDSTVNNTSLVLLLTFRGQSLLFPGDAQWGSWKSWLDWPKAQTILDRVRFLKVSHHGSLNATPKRALEGLPEGFAAMVSTQSRPWPSIPRLPLLKRLGERTRGRLARSDSLPVAGAPRGPKAARAPQGFTTGKLWFDYILPL